MGGWHFIRPYLNDISSKSFAYIGRKAYASPAPGFHSVFKKAQEAIITQAVGPPAIEKSKITTG
jgi:2-oxoglutarate dehydrogenase complex dehydrogenase (E1) component-like enzyme